MSVRAAEPFAGKFGSVLLIGDLAKRHMLINARGATAPGGLPATMLK